MKNTLLTMLILMMMVVMVGCGNKGDNENININDDVNYQKDGKDYLEGLYGKTSLTVDDLDRIDEYRFPESYTYTKYYWDEGDSMVETGNYIYPNGVNHKLLLPIHENMVSREVISSEMENGRICTTVDITLKNGESYPIKYINDPDTLEYVRASLNTPTSTILYTFEY